MNYGQIKKFDIADGLGVRVSLFVSGCRNHCKGCFQPETWSFDYGKTFDKTVEREVFDALCHPYIDGLTILGGEPFEEENQEVLAPFLKMIKRELPNKNIWCYTGYILDQDLLEGGRKHTPYTDQMLSCIDVLVDGPFKEDLKDITLRFRGSSNQRLIDLQKSLEQQEVVPFDPTFIPEKNN